MDCLQCNHDNCRDDALNLLEKTRQLWMDIAIFEDGEIKNESDNKILSNARFGARVEAYVRLFHLLVFET